MPSLNRERIISTKQRITQQGAYVWLDTKDSFKIIESNHITLRDEKPLQHVNMSHSRLHTAGKPLSVWHQIYQILSHPDNKAVLLIGKIVTGMAIRSNKKPQ